MSRQTGGGSWRLAAGAGVIAMLVGALVWSSGAGPGPDRGPVPSRSPIVQSSVAPAVPATVMPERPEDPVVAAARASLEAWARFAGSGDLRVLVGRFAPEGPQYRRLRLEAPDLLGGGHPGPYRLRLLDGSVEDPSSGDERVVQATVMFSGPGGAETWRWDLYLRRTGDRWLLWTVVDTAA